MFSAKDILWGKTTMRIYPDRIEASEGRGAPFERIWELNP
jgi:hypothetical protein